MIYDLLAFTALSVLVLGLAVAGSSTRDFPFDRRLFVAAVALRIVGSLARHEILFRVYRGVGDAAIYFRYGRSFAERLWSGDLSLLTPGHWFGTGRWWGTDFMSNLSGLVVTFIGPSLRAEFLIFSLLAFVGLFLTALGFRRYASPRASNRFAALLWLWPSLWFWPSSVGKESVAVLAAGLVFYGYAGRRHHMSWPWLLAGLALAFAIRPHMAVVLALCLGFAFWVTLWGRPTVRRIVEAVLVVVLGLATLYGMQVQFGLLDVDLEGVSEFVNRRSGYTLRGGSQIEAIPTGPWALPTAFVNIWMRPFPWEAHNATSLLSALEVAALWLLIWVKRRDLWASLKNWRRHRLVRFALPFLLLYTIMIGLTFGNLGIIARQRTPIFFALLLVLSVEPPGAWQRWRNRPSAADDRGSSPRREPIRGAPLSARPSTGTI